MAHKQAAAFPSGRVGRDIAIGDGDSMLITKKIDAATGVIAQG